MNTQDLQFKLNANLPTKDELILIKKNWLKQFNVDKD
jgi:hypothetical protein